MKSFTYVITDETGIHARPAGELVKLTKSFGCNIQIEKDGKAADAKKLLAVMSLGIKKDNEAKFTFDGEDEEAACIAVESFMKENL